MSKGRSAAQILAALSFDLVEIPRLKAVDQPECESLIRAIGLPLAPGLDWKAVGAVLDQAMERYWIAAAGYATDAATPTERARYLRELAKLLKPVLRHLGGAPEAIPGRGQLVACDTVGHPTFAPSFNGGLLGLFSGPSGSATALLPEGFNREKAMALGRLAARGDTRDAVAPGDYSALIGSIAGLQSLLLAAQSAAEGWRQFPRKKAPAIREAYWILWTGFAKVFGVAPTSSLPRSASQPVGTWVTWTQLFFELAQARMTSEQKAFLAMNGPSVGYFPREAHKWRLWWLGEEKRRGERKP